MHDPKHQAEYNSCYNSFDPSFVDIMPKKIPNNLVSYEFASLDNLKDLSTFAGMSITTRIKDLEEYTELKKRFSENAKSINNSLDSCLVIIKTYGKLKDGGQGNVICDKPIPVPQNSIFVANDSTHLWERKKDVELIVLDFKYKDILNRRESKLRKDMPPGLSAGFSKGITLSKNDMTIQKWLIVW